MTQKAENKKSFRSTRRVFEKSREIAFVNGYLCVTFIAEKLLAWSLKSFPPVQFVASIRQGSSRKWKSWIIIITTGIRVATGWIFFVNGVVWELCRHHVIDDIRFDCGYKFWHNQILLSDLDIHAFLKDRNFYVSSLNEELVFILDFEHDA